MLAGSAADVSFTYIPGTVLLKAPLNCWYSKIGFINSQIWYDLLLNLSYTVNIIIMYNVRRKLKSN